MPVAAVRGRSWLLSSLLIVATLALGVAVRFGAVGLPWPVRKYGGSVLWAMLIYWLVSTLLRRFSPWLAGCFAEAFAVAVEFFKLVHTPAVERFRGTLAGVLILGRQFSYADIAAYTLAIACAVLLDIALRRRVASR